jgi:hypothetical protein
MPQYYLRRVVAPTEDIKSKAYKDSSRIMYEVQKRKYASGWVEIGQSQAGTDEEVYFKEIIRTVNGYPGFLHKTAQRGKKTFYYVRATAQRRFLK